MISWLKISLPFLGIALLPVLFAQTGGRDCSDTSGSQTQPWRIEDKFDNGIPSWQSYPLAQDIGYDPSLYTARSEGQPVLRRDLINDGQATQIVGLIRPIRLRFDASSRIELAYSLDSPGRDTAVKIVLASACGLRYEVSLSPSLGLKNRVLLDGRQFHLRGDQTEIEAVVIEATVMHAPLGSHSILTLYSFSIHALRPAAPVMIRPRILASSATDRPVADEVVEAGSSAVFTFASDPISLATEDGQGNRVPTTAAIEGKRAVWTPPRNASPGLWTIRVADKRGVLTFRTLVLGSRSAGTGILLTPERLSQLGTEDRFIRLRQSIHAEAIRLGEQLQFNTEAGNSIAALPSQSVFAGLSAYANLMETYGVAIVDNALDYRLTGDATALKNAVRALLTVSAWQTWTPPWFTAHGLHTYYIAGILTERVAVGFDLVSDRLSPEQLHAVEAATLRNSIEPAVRDYCIEQRMPTGGSNHMAHSLGGALAAWTAFDRADPTWRIEHGTSLAQLIDGFEVLLTGLFPGDGSEAEPAGYEEFAMEGVTYGISALGSLGISTKDTNAIMESFWWLRYAQVSPQLVLDTGDTRSVLQALSGYAWLVEHDSDPGARWFYDMAARPLLDPSQSENGTGSGATESQKPPDVLDLLCCTMPIPDYAPPAPSRIFERRGSIMLRDRWVDPEMATSIRVGPWMNHEHHDQGSFQVAVHGQLLVGEGGYTDYYKDPNYKTYFSEAPAHNVVLIDHDSFSQDTADGRYWKALSRYPTIVSSFLADDIGYVDADLTPVYGATLENFRRRFVFVGPGLLIVNDEIISRSPHVFDWLLHPGPSVAVERKPWGIILSSPQSGDSLTVLAEDPNLSWQLADTPVSVNLFDNLDRRPVERRQMLSLDSKPVSRASFLVGLSTGGMSRPSPLERRTTANGRGFLLDHPDRQTLILFRNGEGPIRISDASTDGDLLVAVTSGSGAVSRVFAANARSLRFSNDSKIEMSAPGTCLWDRSGKSVSLLVLVRNETRIAIDAPLESGSLRLDDTVSHGEIKLTPGRHRLQFELAATAEQ